MTDWKMLYARRDWDALEDWWRGCDDPKLLSAFLKRLRTDVPEVRRQNGMEEQRDHARPDEAQAEWKGAAKILYLGELAATVEGEPEPAPDEWHRKRSEIAELLGALVDADEVTKGDPSLSRSAHAKNALDLFDSINWCVTAMSNEIDPDDTKPEDREWLRAFAGEIASLAFNAGAHARAAIGKEIEQHAVRGKKILVSAKDGGQTRKGQVAAETERALQKMDELILNGHTASGAAQIAAQQGFGTSANANRQLLKRHRWKENET